MMNDTSPQTPNVFAPPERSTIVGGSALVAGLMLGSVVLQFSVDETLPFDERWIAGSLGALVALTALAAAHRLLTLRGGIWIDHVTRRLGLGITGMSDIWWVGLDQLQAIVCARRAISSDIADFAWRSAARMNNGVELVLVETHEHDIAQAVADELSERCALPKTEEPLELPPHTSGQSVLRVSERVAMHGILSISGFTLTVLGGALYSQVEAAPGFAFFVAPVLLFTGVALLGVVITKRLAAERLTHQGGLWTHSFTFGPWSWGERTISAPQPVWNLHIRPARGARLELEGEDGTLVIGNGATTRSRASIEALITLPDRFRSAPPTPQTAPAPAPLPEA